MPWSSAVRMNDPWLDLSTTFNFHNKLKLLITVGCGKDNKIWSTRVLQEHKYSLRLFRHHDKASQQRWPEHDSHRDKMFVQRSRDTWSTLRLIHSKNNIATKKVNFLFSKTKLNFQFPSPNSYQIGHFSSWTDPQSVSTQVWIVR